VRGVKVRRPARRVPLQYDAVKVRKRISAGDLLFNKDPIAS